MRNSLAQRVGWGAGILLLLLIVAGLTPQVIVRYELHAFTGKLHAGMSSSDVQTAAASMHLDAMAPHANEMVVRITPPWVLGSACTIDYAVVVELANDRVTRWNPIKEQLCTK